MAFHEDSAWEHAVLAREQQPHVARLLACAAKEGLATLDTWDGFTAAGMPAKAETFFRGGHFADAGAKVAAGLIAPQLPR